MFRDAGDQLEEEAKEHGKTVKVHITSNTPVLQGFVDFFSISSVFNSFYIFLLVLVELNGI